MFMGHGRMINRGDVVEYVKLKDMNVSVTTCQIASPTSTCVMMAETLIKIKDWLLENGKNIEDNRVNDLFQQSIMGAQNENLKCLYRSKDWAVCRDKKFNYMAEYTERYLYDLNENDQLPNKHFTSDNEQLYGQSGVHIIKNNVGLENGIYFSFPMILEEFISHFAENYGVHKFYLVDFTCSVLSEDVTQRTRRYVARNIIKQEKAKGGTRKKDGKKNKSKNKSKNRRKNTRKITRQLQ